MATTNDMIRDLGSKLWPFLSIGEQDVQEAFGTLVKFLQDAKDREKQARAELSKRNEDVLGEYKRQVEKKLSECFLFFSAKERISYDAFVKRHYKKCANGGKMTIHLTGTGIGCCYQLECPVCHEQVDITDTESW